MGSVDERLVRRKDRLVLLLTPPFDRMTPSPGHQGYLQASGKRRPIHACRAVERAGVCRLGDGDRAAELFSILNPVNHSRTPDDVRDIARNRT
jgi:cyclic beta-1,2-glucan synthetase